MKRVWLMVIVVSIGVAYFVGLWPEHRRFVDADARLRSTQEQLTSANAKVRLGEVLGGLLRFSDAVSARNYGEATTLSSAYFDRVRQEASRPDQAAAHEMLNRLLQGRDAVTTAIARSDPALSSLIRTQEVSLRQALGYPVTSAPTTPPTSP